MIADIALLTVAITLAGGAYLFKRHAGTLIVIIMAGALVASIGATPTATWLASRGIELTMMPLEGVVTVTIILLPALLGWFAAPKGNGKIRRLAGALLLGLVGAAAVAPAIPGIFDEAIVSQARSATWLKTYEAAIMAGGLFYALIDLYLGKLKHGKEEHKKGGR